jgi:glycosyltransferase involved in cell wall biosynthesis
MSGPVVSVIMAAFNAGGTIEVSLGSALAQTHRDLEIIVVDDGSTDDTAAVAARVAAGDARVRLIRKANEGVSSARNAAIAVAQGDYVAPLDADDVWHSTKIEKQLKVATAAPGGPPGFVYTWSRRIDGAGMVLSSGGADRVRGRALHRHLFRNFVGTGSSVLMPRFAVIEAGGYDEGLARSEDYLLQLRIAARHPVDVVPEYLVGYRVTPGSLTSSREAMFEAWMEVRRISVALWPAARAITRWPHGKRCFTLAEGRAQDGRWLACAALLARAIWSDPVWTVQNLRHRIARAVGRRAWPAAAEPLQPFATADLQTAIETDPHETSPGAQRLARLEARRMEKLARLDEA